MNTRQKLIDIVANSLIYWPTAARLSSQEIADLAGISQPGVHYHFKKLDDLYEAGYAQFMNKFTSNRELFTSVIDREVRCYSPFILWINKIYGEPA